MSALRGKSTRHELGNERAGAYVERSGDGWRWLAWLGRFVAGGVAADATNAWCAVLHALGDVE